MTVYIIDKASGQQQAKKKKKKKYCVALRENKGSVPRLGMMPRVTGFSIGENSQFGNNRNSIIIFVQRNPKECLSINVLLCMLHVVKTYQKAWNWQQAAPDHCI